MNRPYPSKANSHVFIYPHGNSMNFTKTAKRLNEIGHKHSWCLWRKEMPDTTHEFNQIIGSSYVAIPKQILQRDISQSFADHHINYIMESGAWRMYASFDHIDEMYDPFYCILDSITVIRKYEVFDLFDNWELYHDGQR